MASKVPSEKRIADAVNEVAKAFDVSPEAVRQVTGTSARPALQAVSLARWSAWRTVLAAGFSEHMLAKSWGCHPTSIRHGLKRLAEVEADPAMIRARNQAQDTRRAA